MVRHDLAMPQGADPAALSRRLEEAHDQFVSTGLVDPALRRLVFDSWRRSVDGGLDPEQALAADPARRGRARRHPRLPSACRRHARHPPAAGRERRRGRAAGRGQRRRRAAAVGRGRLDAARRAPRACTSCPAPTGARPAPAPTRPAPRWPWAARCRSSAPSTWPGRSPRGAARPRRSTTPTPAPILGVLDLTGGPEVATAADPGPGPGHGRRGRGRAAASSGSVPRRPPTGGSGWTHPAPSTCSGGRGATLRHGDHDDPLSLRHSEILLLLAESGDGMTAGGAGRRAERGRAGPGHDPRRAVPAADRARARSGWTPGPTGCATRSPPTSTDVRERPRRRPAAQRRRALPRPGPAGLDGARPSSELRDELHMPYAPRLLAARRRRRAAGVRRHRARSRRLRDLAAAPSRSCRRPRRGTPQVAAHVGRLDAALA